ncbi:Lipoprotein signal peptidase [compost metagenome]
MVYYLIALIVFLVDQGTKYLIATRLELGEQIPVIKDFFMITSHRNQGAAFGILQGQQWFFVVVTVIVVAGIVWYLNKARATRKLLPTALALVLGGAVGNFLDRLLNGEVVDFLMFNFGSYTFPIFNVADSCIVIGVALIILDTLLDMKSGEEINEVKETKETKETKEVKEGNE